MRRRRPDPVFAEVTMTARPPFRRKPGSSHFLDSPRIAVRSSPKDLPGFMRLQ